MSQEDSSIKPDKTLDMKGLLCPEPVFRTRQTIKEMNIDEILEVFADEYSEMKKQAFQIH